MKKKQRKEYIDGLNKLLKLQNKNLSREQKELIVSVREGIKYSTNKTEILDWLLKLAALMFGISDLKDLL